MKGLWASFRLELCASVRSRALALLTGASLAWVLAVPHVLKGDGSVVGWFELCVRYSLGVVFALVLVSLAASAAGSLAKDRAAKRLQLSLVRPTPHFAIALGRMLALTAVGAFVLALAALTMTLRLRPFQAESGYGRFCDHVIEPQLASPHAAVEERLAELRKDNPDFVEKGGERDIRRFLLRYVTSRYETVRPGEQASWTFDTSSVGDGSEVAVRLRVTDVFDRLEQVDATLRLGDREGRLTHVNKTLVKVPLDRAAGEASEADPSVLTLANGGGLAVSLCPYRDLHLLVKADAFGWNVFRAWIVLSGILSVVIAFSLFLGSCLSRSVAIFSVVSLLAISTISPVLVEDYPDPSGMTWLDRVSMRLTDFAVSATSPLSVYSPISDLESTTCVEWRAVGSSIGLNVILLPLVLSWLAGLVMVRKQDGI